MTPLGKGESVSQYVARVVDIVDRSGLPYVLTPMGTIIEGESWDEVMSVLKEGFEALKKRLSPHIHNHEDRLQRRQVWKDTEQG